MIYLKLLVAHVTSEGGGQPTNGWLFSVTALVL